MLSTLFTSWKTTTGGGISLAAALIDILTQYSTKSWDAQRLLTDAIGIGAGIVGLFAKDHNVTGGTKANQ
jgi:hypothetical protein